MLAAARTVEDDLTTQLAQALANFETAQAEAAADRETAEARQAADEAIAFGSRTEQPESSDAVRDYAQPLI